MATDDDADHEERQRENDRRTKQLIWDRIEGARGPRPTLTHEEIARAAVEIADADGLNAVTMRRLAEHLGVATMGLYRYVSGKDDIYELMLNAGLGEIALPDGDWRAVAESYARQTRAACLRHPWMNQVQTLVPYALTPRATALTERALAAIDGLGVDPDSMMATFGTVAAFVRGATTMEVASQEVFRSRGWSSDEDMRLAYMPYVRRLIESGDYPTLTKYIIEGSNEDDADWQFEFGLQCVLDGIAARLGI